MTFTMAIAWLCLFTYLMVWMVTVIGFTFGIPDSIMGITFLAAGSSVPDALSSVLVVRQGLVDMGVSNTFGSNVFDLLIGLALPWFCKILISGEAIHINSNGLIFDSVLLLGIVIITVSDTIVMHRRA
jgi:solute carrier family 24 (sodium/potassium/calcium exchanger), member 4